MSPTKMHIKKGDTVIVVAGKDKGVKGKVLQVNPETSRAVVEGANVVKRHTRPTQAMPQGGIIEKEAPIHSSNLQIVCKACGEPSRVGKKFLEDKTKVRYCKNCGELIDK